MINRENTESPSTSIEMEQPPTLTATECSLSIIDSSCGLEETLSDITGIVPNYKLTCLKLAVIIVAYFFILYIKSIILKDLSNCSR